LTPETKKMQKKLLKNLVISNIFCTIAL